MESNRKSMILSVLTAMTFILMVTTNALANILPINGIGTGEVSDYYANLFAPAGFTFAIWGVIYLLLLGYTGYQMSVSFKKESTHWKLINQVNIFFSMSSLANTIWIFMWHYEVIWASLILMFVILGCLIKINLLIRSSHISNKPGVVLVQWPFAVYFGWITVATIANVTTFLVAIQWNGFGISEAIWMDLIIIVGTIIGIFTLMTIKSIPYGLVILWAYYGIVSKHIASTGFNGGYMSVIVTVLVAMVVVIFAMITVVKTKGINKA